jgi:glycerophosphoryl diester phosphodiesterase
MVQSSLVILLASLFALMASATAGSTAEHPLIVAHRGECFIAPENTMASYDLAWKKGDDAIELDIHLTKDGQVVVCHDSDTFRTSGNKEKVVLKNATLAEIQKVDVGSFKGPQYAGQHCPTLKEVFDGMPAGKKCYVEIKSGIDVVPAWVELFKASGKTPDQIIVISFHADALAASKKALPQLKHYLLASYKQDKATKQWPDHPGVEDWIAEAKKGNADGLDLGANAGLTEARCKQVTDAGLELHVWTTAAITKANSSVDDPKVAAQYAAWGAKSITTNRAALIGQALNGATK